jgi:hypothetical protein
MTNKKELLTQITLHRERLNYDMIQMQESYKNLITSCESIARTPITSLDRFLTWYLTPVKLWEIMGAAFLAGAMTIPLLSHQATKLKK